MPIHYLLLLLLLLVSDLQPGANDTVQARKMLDSTKVLIDRQQYDSALGAIDTSIAIFENSGDERGLNEAIFTKGKIYQYKKEQTEALKLYRKASPYLLSHLTEKELFELSYYNRIGGVCMDIGYRTEGRMLLEKSYELCRKYDDADSVATATAHYNLGLNCLYFGENRQGINHFLQALPVYLREFGENGKRVAQLYNNLGILYTETGDYERALDYFNRAVAIHIETEGPGYWNLAYPYNGIASVYDEMGEKKKAFDYYQQALAICATDPYLDRVETASRASLVIYYSDTGMPDSAFYHADKAIRLIKTKYFDTHPRLVDLYRVKGEANAALKDWDKAANLYHQAKAIVALSYGDVHPKMAGLYLYLSQLDTEQGNYDIALARIDSGFAALYLPNVPSKENLQHISDLPMYLKLQAKKAAITYEIAKSKNEDAKYLEAITAYKECIHITDIIRSGYMSEQSKMFLQANLVGICEKALQSCYDLYQLSHPPSAIAAAFYFMEKSKASVLSESLQSYYLNNIRGVPETITDAETQLTRTLKDLRVQLEEMAQQDTAARDSIALLLFEASIASDSLGNVLREQYPKYYQLRYGTDVLTLEDVRAQLAKGEAALTYFSGDSSWMAMLVAKDTVLLQAIPVQVAAADLDSSLVNIKNPAAPLISYTVPANNVYQQLVAPMLVDKNKYDRLIIIPDGKLGYLPFEALPVASADNTPSYLLERYKCCYANSLTMFCNNRQQPQQKLTGYIGFAPGESGSTTRDDQEATLILQGTEAEVTYAGKLFSGQVFVNAAATELNFRQHIAPGKILHLAMHAQADDAAPMHSKLLFAEGTGVPEDDGQLNAYELYALDLQSELAVLSACNTGTGELRRGEGIMSLSRAFMYAGCPNVVMSLWPARDLPTTAIMKSFLQYVSDGMDKDAALQKAKQHYLNNADPLTSHPANWATFILVGDNLPVKSDNKIVFLISVLIIAGLLLTIYLLRSKKKFQQPAAS